jgi:hypothetical protein
MISSFRREVAGKWFLLGYYAASSGKGITTTRCVMTQKSALPTFVRRDLWRHTEGGGKSK